ncbi:hypothetical protein E3N88_38635 [Mikania micrantha]|uniref:Uncharacterized protein n=1 Tax=Mikania micrantha TaxID=192012 RepID=A0A5N6LUI8_9ASTR|nr:hypothetical protein E3N88_38635 [Mikania micrantha]
MFDESGGGTEEDREAGDQMGTRFNHKLSARSNLAKPHLVPVKAPTMPPPNLPPLPPALFFWEETPEPTGAGLDMIQNPMKHHSSSMNQEPTKHHSSATTTILQVEGSNQELNRGLKSRTAKLDCR